jgi:Calcineurin-like phosphoesterase
VFADVVNYDYLLVTAERTRLNLQKVIEGRGLRELRDDRVLAYAGAVDIEDEPPAYAAAADIEGGPLAEFSAEQIQEVIDELDRACDELSSERDRESDWMCIPSIPILAILQSELTTAFEQLPWAFARLDEDNVDGRIAQTPDQIRVTHLWGPYEVTDPPIFGDPRWLWMEVVKLWYKLKDDKIDFGGLPTQPVTIANEARIVLVGDWGSGHKRAKKVAREIRKILKKGLDEGKEQYVIHLGDVYFTGSGKEYEKNFLRYWPVKHGEDIGSFIICGNHDMYRGGHAYYGTALADSRFAQQDRKSVFALRNDNWQFLGLDTAYENKQISNGQVQWIERQLKSAPNHRTTMLSHHPLWSAYRDTGQELRKQISPVLAGRRIDAWFWGHEHRCLVYKPRKPVDFTSCVGHGGIPSYLTAAKGDPYLKYEYRKRHRHGLLHQLLGLLLGLKPRNTFGFAVIDLDARDMHVRYIDEDGTPHHVEHL